MKLVQIVTSALNEEGNIEEFCTRLQGLFEIERGYIFEVLIFDNASSDDTWAKIEEVVKTDGRFKGYLMSRQFSLDASLTAGIDLATADAVITMASDLQDEPEKISDFLRAWENGHDLVLGQVKKRPELSRTFKLLTPVYYKLAHWASDGLLYKNVSDFRLMSKVVYQSVRSLREQHRFMRGLTAWTGFSPHFLEIDRQPRFSGNSKNRFVPVFSLALHGILSQSTKPIALISTVGLVLPILFSFLFFSFLILWILKGVPFAGFGSLVALTFLLFSINFFFLGILGQYISMIVLDTKQRPLYIIRKAVEKVDRTPLELKQENQAG